MAQLLAAGVAANAAKKLLPGVAAVLPGVANVAQNAAGSVGGAVGSIFGKKAGRVGKKIGRGIVGFGRKLFGFNAGGKVRILPVRALKKGGMVQVVLAKPKRKSRRKK